MLLKPDAVKRDLGKQIEGYLIEKNLKLLEKKRFTLDKSTAMSHYIEHKNKPFFNELMNFITSGEIEAWLIEGDKAVKILRELIGATDPLKAELGTIRGDLKDSETTLTKNLVHASDSHENAKREIRLFFPFHLKT